MSDSTEPNYRLRRQRVFLLLAGIFLGTLAMLNILGITRFVDLSFELFGLSIPMVVAIGVLPYPITFLCTDLLSEIYGEKRAGDVVWVGLLLNLWVLFILWIGGMLPGFEAVDANGALALDAAGREPVFFEVRALAYNAMAASMLAYLFAQFCDVRLFHFWKRLTGGKHLWLRNNASTLVSQLVDTTAVILITYTFSRTALPIDEAEELWPQLLMLIASGYAFKFIIAVLDTGPLYFIVSRLRPYLGLQHDEEVAHDDSGASLYS